MILFCLLNYDFCFCMQELVNGEIEAQILLCPSDFCRGMSTILHF